MGFGPGVRVRPLEMKHLGCRAVDVNLVLMHLVS